MIILHVLMLSIVMCKAQDGNHFVNNEHFLINFLAFQISELEITPKLEITQMKMELRQRLKDKYLDRQHLHAQQQRLGESQ